MKSRIITAVAVVTLIVFASLLIIAMTAYPMHLGEPSWYHVARVDCLTAAVICGFVSFVSAMLAIASVHF